MEWRVSCGQDSVHGLRHCRRMAQLEVAHSDCSSGQRSVKAGSAIECSIEQLVAGSMRSACVSRSDAIVSKLAC